MTPPTGNLTNDGAELTPVTAFKGPALEFDFPGLKVGIAEYAEGPTGCTVFRFPAGSTGLADVRGGAPAEILSYREGWVDAICLAGGSAYGLEASTGVSAELLARKDYDTDWKNIAIVSGAVLFDFNRFRINRSIYPDKALGRAALGAAVEGRFPLGPRGAGVSATVGKWLRETHELEGGGQGAAFHEQDGVKVCVFTVVNSVGCLVDREGRAVRGHVDPDTGERRRVGEVYRMGGGVGEPRGDPPPGNTTLSVVVTNQPMDLRGLRQLARQVHSSMARAIDPFHTMHDGDVLYAVTTNSHEGDRLHHQEISHIASELAWDAVLCAY